MKHRQRIVVAAAVCACAAGPVRAFTLTAPRVLIRQGASSDVNHNFNQCTSLTFGPDGRLYITQLDGRIQAVTLDASRNVVAIQTINKLFSRAAMGIAFNPVSGAMYVSHSDQPGAHTNTKFGYVSRLSGPDYFTRTDVVGGLSQSDTQHLMNNIEFKPGTQTLFICHCGMTANGVAGYSHFGNEPEKPHSAAILTADLTGDPDQAPWSLYASGFRNPYDLVFASNGRIYATDNGPNAGEGPTPSGKDPGTREDEINVIEPGMFYGHPNPSRGENTYVSYNGAIVFDPPVPANFHPALYAPSQVQLSINGITEYPFRVPGWHRSLITGSFVTGDVFRYRLNDAGTAVVDATVITSGRTAVLDVTVGADGALYGVDMSPGTLWVMEPDSPLPASGDVDNDGDVDLGDFGSFQVCFNGPQRPPAFEGCELVDFDNDSDVDLADFAVFLSCFNGADRPAAPGCP